MKLRLPALLLAIALPFGSLAGVALATDAPPAGADAAALINALDQDPHKELLADIVKKGRSALERATRMRVAGDDAHAKLAEGIALEWAETGRDLLATAQVEEHAAQTADAVLDAGAALERDNAAIEATTLRRGRLEAALRSLEREAEAADAGHDAGRAPVKPAQKHAKGHG